MVVVGAAAAGMAAHGLGSGGCSGAANAFAEAELKSLLLPPAPAAPPRPDKSRIQSVGSSLGQLSASMGRSSKGLYNRGVVVVGGTTGGVVALAAGVVDPVALALHGKVEGRAGGGGRIRLLLAAFDVGGPQGLGMALPLAPAPADVDDDPAPAAEDDEDDGINPSSHGA